MADQVIDIGEGLDYSGTYGFKNCCNDFTNMAGQGHVQIRLKKESYDYICNFNIDKTGVDASNFFEVTCYPGDEHLGSFANPVTLIPELISGTLLGGLNVYDGFHRFNKLLFKQHTAGTVILLRFLGGTDYRVEDVLLYNDTDLLNGSGSYGIFLNASTEVDIKKVLAYHKGLGTYSLFMYASSIATVRKMLIYMPNSSLYPGAGGVAIENANSASSYKEVGVVSYLNGMGAAYTWNNPTNATGEYNFSNFGITQPIIGTSSLRSTLSGFAYTDPTNLKFYEKPTSNLIGSGLNDLTGVGDPINSGEWGGFHRSVFGHTILTSYAERSPSSCRELSGQFSDNVIFAVPFNGTKYSEFSKLKYNNSQDRFIDSMYGLVHHQIDSSGYYVEYDAGILKSKKSFTVVFVLRPIYTTNSYASIFTSNSSTVKAEYQGVTKALKITVGSFTATTTLSDYVDTSKFFAGAIVVNIGAGADPERVKSYSLQIGILSKHAHTYAGTMPSDISGVLNLQIGRCLGDYGNFAIISGEVHKDRILQLLSDPYEMYRDFYDIDALIAAGYIRGPDGFWRHKSTLFGHAMSMAGTSTMVV